jgi:tRNA(adenine34) deaminase
MIHGHPTWSYLWRHLIPIGVRKGYRVISLDLPGYGRSDKPINKNFFKFNIYRNVVLNFINNLNLQNITLFLHEWGGTLGMTLPMERENSYEGMVDFNSYLGNSLANITQGYKDWINTNINTEFLNVRALMARTNRILNLSECNAYESPFLQKESKLSLRMLPSIFPLNPEHDGFEVCKKALEWWQENTLKQVIVIGGGRDPLIPIEKMRTLSKIISTDEQTHVINNAGHFVPEWGMEFGEELFRQLKDG